MVPDLSMISFHCNALHSLLISTLTGTTVPVEKVKENSSILVQMAPNSNLSTKADLTDLLALTDVLIVNETEAEIITGLKMSSNSDDQVIDQMMTRLVQRVPSVVMTLGDKGAAFTTRHTGVGSNSAPSV